MKEKFTQPPIQEVPKKKKFPNFPNFKVMMLGLLASLQAIDKSPAQQADQEFYKPRDKNKSELLQSTQEPDSNQSASDIESSVETESGLNWPEGRFTLFNADKDGNYDFNYLHLLFPAQLEVGTNEQLNKNFKIQVPYLYARLFEADQQAGEAVTPSDHELMVKFVQQQLQQELYNSLTGLAVNKEAYLGDNPEALDPQKFKVKNLKVTGFASFEGPQAKGPITLEKEKTDLENIRLALKRGHAGLEATKQAMTAMGIETPAEVGDVYGSEIQPAEENLERLFELAANYPGQDEYERLFNLIVEYNDDKVSDPKLKKELDEIIGSMRKIEIEVELEGGRKSVLFIPLPLLLLLGASLPYLVSLFRRRRPERVEAFPAGPDQEPEDAENNTLAQFSTVPAEHILPNDVIVDTRLPEESSRDYHSMREQTLLNDLNNFFSRPETSKRGLDYQHLCLEMERDFDNFNSPESRQNALAADIIDAWKKHDRQCRQEAGFNPDKLDSGLDYENQPSQIQWAKMHAGIILELIAQRRGGSRQDYRVLLDEKVREHYKNNPPERTSSNY
ncbi:MAG: hypothetical protein NUV82_03380 [Candidatus Komeilibacteria bacterium]|nr:hypothetical protein [Candidatus Komeilibacteria bacterium]